MERRAIRITIELPEDLAGSGGIEASAHGAGVTGTATGGADQAAAPEQSTGQGAGAAIDGGAPSPDLVAALGGEPGFVGQSQGASGGADVQGGTRDERGIDAGPLPEHVAAMLEASGPRHPMAESADFRAAYVGEGAFHRN